MGTEFISCLHFADADVFTQEGNEAPAARLKGQARSPKPSSSVPIQQSAREGLGVGGGNDELPGASGRPLGAKADLTKITKLPQQPAAQAVRVGGRAGRATDEQDKAVGGMATPEPEPLVAVVGEIFERESTSVPLPPTAPNITTNRGFPSAKHRSALKFGKARQEAAAGGEAARVQDDQPIKVRH